MSRSVLGREYRRALVRHHHRLRYGLIVSWTCWAVSAAHVLWSDGLIPGARAMLITALVLNLVLTARYADVRAQVILDMRTPRP